MTLEVRKLHFDFLFFHNDNLRSFGDSIKQKNGDLSNVRDKLLNMYWMPVFFNVSVKSVMNTRTRKEPTFVYDKCGFFSTKSVLSDGINPLSWDEITSWWNPTSSGDKDGFNFICEADFIRAEWGFHRACAISLNSLQMCGTIGVNEVIVWLKTNLLICQQNLRFKS